MTTWLVEPLAKRPAVPLIITFLWGEDHNVDSDGDSSNPESNEWTWLYVASRERPDEVVNVDVVEASPNRFKVESDLPWLAAATAYFLALDGDALVRAVEGDGWVDRRVLEQHVAPFDLRAASERVQRSR
jgi:hypothetical protein